MNQQKKKPKLNKKFKDDIPPLAPKRANPMEPPDDQEEIPNPNE